MPELEEDDDEELLVEDELLDDVDELLEDVEELVEEVEELADEVEELLDEELELPLPQLASAAVSRATLRFLLNSLIFLVVIGVSIIKRKPERFSVTVLGSCNSPASDTSPALLQHPTYSHPDLIIIP